MIIDSGLPLLAFLEGLGDYAEDGIEIINLLAEIRALYKSGLTFVFEERNGKTYFQISSAAGELLSTKQMKAALKALGLNTNDNIMKKLFGRGMVVFDSKNPGAASKMLDNVADTGDALSDAARHADKLQNPGYSPGVFDVISWVISGGVAAHDAHYDARSGRYITPTAETVTDAARNAAVDIGVDIALDVGAVAVASAATAGIVAAAKIGGTVGACAGPIGVIVGVVAGLVVGAILTYKDGEPPKSIMDHAKGWLEEADTFVDNAWARLTG